MRRFGVPDGVDLRALDSFIWQQGRPFLLGDPRVAGLAHAELTRLGVPRPTLWGWLLEQRLAITALVLVVLGILAVRKSTALVPPPDARDASGPRGW
jgi:hypothetical protein